jgi:DNA repair photolyase
MIISASRRTDIPAFHAEWFFRRLREGNVIVKNNPKDERYYRVPLTPDLVDCVVFRTKNPAPMLSRLDELGDYNYLFNITMNPYGREMEANLPRLVERVETYKKLAEKVGSLRMIWRYDPVMLSQKYDLDFHRRAFEYLCRELASHSYKCMIGFIINHRFIAGRMAPMAINQRSEADMRAIGEVFGGIAARYGQKLETCATEVSLDEFGITHGACVEREQIEKIVGSRFEKVRERYLRPHCNCMGSIDIGHYSTCGNGCQYCYATIETPRLDIPFDSPSLDPHFDPAAPVVDIKCRSFRPAQTSLW